MLQVKRKESAFTLIELLVVVIIVAVLAAVGVPLLSANVQRSRMTEAETGLGTVRTALRSYIVENSALPSAGGTFLTSLGFASTDFQGQFFSSADYDLTDATSTTNYCIGIKSATGPGGSKVGTERRSMDEFGTIYKGTTNNCT